MSVIIQNGSSALMMAAEVGRTEVVSLLLEAGANIELQNKVLCQCIYMRGGVIYEKFPWGGNISVVSWIFL